MLKLGNATNFRRTATGLSLLGASLLMLTGMLTTPWETEDTTAAYLDALAANPVQGQVAATFLHYGFLLFVPGFLGLLAVLKGRGVVLGHIGAVLAVVGWASISGFLIVDFYDLGIAQALPRAEGVALEERIEGYGGGLALYLPAFVGAMVGPFLIALALWRARHVGIWLPVLAVSGTVLALATPPSLFWSSLAAVVGVLSWGMLGALVLRTSDRAWEAGRLEGLTGRRSAAPTPNVA